MMMHALETLPGLAEILPHHAVTKSQGTCNQLIPCTTMRFHEAPTAPASIHGAFVFDMLAVATTLR